MGNILHPLLKFIKPRKFSNNHTGNSGFLTPRKLKQLEEIIGCSIVNKNYYIQALVHRSFLEHNESLEYSNERLEFLGDSVLNLIIGEFLFTKFPEEDEGFLTKVRAKMVNRNALVNAAERANLEKFILIGRNLSRTAMNSSKSIFSDAIEALIGAIYLDSGLSSCRKFITKVIITPTLDYGEHLVDENYKSQLLEYAQANKMDIPNYEVINEEGPQHERIFTVEVNIGQNRYGIGNGNNKKTAEQNAARRTLKLLKQSEEF